LVIWNQNTQTEVISYQIWRSFIFKLKNHKNDNNKLTYPEWTKYKLKSHGFGSTLMHLYSIWCLKSDRPASTSNPIILLSAPTDNITLLCFSADKPMTAEECSSRCSDLCLYDKLSSPSFRHNMTEWSDPPVRKQRSLSHGGKVTLFIKPLLCGFASKKETRFWFYN
jgi:hypothetical protein